MTQLWGTTNHNWNWSERPFVCDVMSSRHLVNQFFVRSLRDNKMVPCLALSCNNLCHDGNFDVFQLVDIGHLGCPCGGVLGMAWWFLFGCLWLPLIQSHWQWCECSGFQTRTAWHWWHHFDTMCGVLSSTSLSHSYLIFLFGTHPECVWFCARCKDGNGVLMSLFVSESGCT